MSEKLTLTVSPRTIFGKKLKVLRRQGIVPANIYGKHIPSTAIQVEGKELISVVKQAGETTLIELSLEKEKRPVLIHGVQKDPVDGNILHVDFHQVNLKEKTTAAVPLKLVGESEAVKSGVGLLLQTLSELEVEALPQDIPHEVEVDVSSLTEVGQSFLVKDLKVPSGVSVLTDSESPVVSLQQAEMEEEVVEETPTEVEVISEKKEEGEETPEGETPSEEAPKEE